MKTWRFVVCAINITILLSLAGCHNDKHEIARSEARADSIITALELYEQTYGVYPDTLDELIPEFIAKIPLPADGYDFEYSSYDPVGYLLSFSLRYVTGDAYSICTYSPEVQVWTCTSGVMYE